MVENCTGQLETLALTTSDPKEENRPLIQISCKLDLNKAELPIILISTLIVNLLAFAVLLRMRGSCDTLDHRLVSILNVNDTLTAGIFTFMWLSGWASCDTLLIKPIFCGLFGWLGSALVVWSAFIIVIMTTCRFLSLVKPLYYRTRVTTAIVTRASVGTLIFCLVFFLPPFTGYTAPYRIYEDNHVCANDFAPGEKGLFQRAFIGLIGVIGCLTVIHVVLCNVTIARTLRKRNAIHNVQSDIAIAANNGNGTSFQMKRRVFGHVTLVVSFVYALCYAPFVVRLVIDTINNLNHQNNQVHSVSMSLLFLSPFLNPIVYGIFNKHFRQTLLDLLRTVCIKRSRRLQVNNRVDHRPSRNRYSHTAGIDIHVVMGSTSQSYRQGCSSTAGGMSTVTTGSRKY